MSFGWGVGNFVAILGLAIKVYTSYRDAPGDYRDISEEAAAFRILIEKAAQHFNSPTISSDDRYYGQKVLNGCQDILEDLNSVIEKYKSLAVIDVVTFRERLISNAVLLNGFVRRFAVPFQTFCSTNPMNINISILVVTMLRSKRN